MKFVTLSRDFYADDPKMPLFPIKFAKGKRLGIRSGNMFENGDYLTSDGHTFVRHFHFGYGQDLKIPVEYLTAKSISNLMGV